MLMFRTFLLLRFTTLFKRRFLMLKNRKPQLQNLQKLQNAPFPPTAAHHTAQMLQAFHRAYAFPTDNQHSHK
jgi:hypothetical protein